MRRVSATLTLRLSKSSVTAGTSTSTTAPPATEPAAVRVVLAAELGFRVDAAADELDGPALVAACLDVGLPGCDAPAAADEGAGVGAELSAMSAATAASAAAAAASTDAGTGSGGGSCTSSAG